MAMRLFSKEEFWSELKCAGLEPTEILTKTGRLWKTKDDLFISVPETEEQYPDSILESVLRKINQLYSLQN